jgi:hypothetical protein
MGSNVILKVYRLEFGVGRNGGCRIRFRYEVDGTEYPSNIYERPARNPMIAQLAIVLRELRWIRDNMAAPLPATETPAAAAPAVIVIPEALAPAAVAVIDIPAQPVSAAGWTQADTNDLFGPDPEQQVMEGVMPIAPMPTTRRTSGGRSKGKKLDLNALPPLEQAA